MINIIPSLYSSLFYVHTINMPTCVIPLTPICFRWEVGDWQACTRPCGKFGRQERPLYCITDFYGDPVHVDMAYCDATTMPEHVRDCKRAPCPADWLALPWGEVGWFMDVITAMNNGKPKCIKISKLFLPSSSVEPFNQCIRCTG